MDTTTTVERYSGYLQAFNTGAMLALQSNPTDTTTTCQTKTTETNALLDLMFKGTSYTTGDISQAEF